MCCSSSSLQLCLDHPAKSERSFGCAARLALTILPEDSHGFQIRKVRARTERKFAPGAIALMDCSRCWCVSFDNGGCSWLRSSSAIRGWAADFAESGNDVGDERNAFASGYAQRETERRFDAGGRGSYRAAAASDDTERRQRRFRETASGKFTPVETIASCVDRSAERAEGHAGPGDEKPHRPGRRPQFDERRTEWIDCHHARGTRWAAEARRTKLF